MAVLILSQTELGMGQSGTCWEVASSDPASLESPSTKQGRDSDGGEGKPGVCAVSEAAADVSFGSSKALHV